MLSVITNICNKKTKGPALMELFAATGKLIFFLQLEMFDVCTTGDTVTHRYERPFCHYIQSHRLAAEMWTTMKNNLQGGEKK